MREQEKAAGPGMDEEVKCVQEVEVGDFPAVFRFIVQDG